MMFRIADLVVSNHVQGRDEKGMYITVLLARQEIIICVYIVFHVSLD